MKTSLQILALVAVATLTLSAVQTRSKPKSEKDFAVVLRDAGSAWEKGEYGTCVKSLQTALGLATTKRAASIRAAFPAAPAGWKMEPAKKSQENPFAAALAGTVGNAVQVSYRQDGGRGRIDATLTADSPMVQMFSAWVANPALLGDEAELIGYGDHKGVLKNERNGLNLQILIHGAHMCEVRAQGIDDEGLFAIFDQALVDKLATVLGK